jgi:phage host-nuclease inhibitor protein Gam
LLKTFRRRQQFDWSAEVEPFTGPRHVRYASHWDGTNKPRAARCSENEEKQGKRDTSAEGYQLSEREKAWKKQMDAFRKRIEADPYEAVFGKRFEPFWTPLVPQWMREDIGFSKKDPEKAAASVEGSARREKNAHITPSDKQPSDSGNTATEQQAGKQTQPYAYRSSTSWDSQSSKTKRSEWDSVSRKTTNYEYDPVSNRMIPTEPRQTVSVRKEQADVPAHVIWKPIVAKPRSKSEPININSDRLDPAAQTSKYAETTVNGSTAGRPGHGDVISTQPQNSGLDGLTAFDVRASMGKPKRQENVQEVVPEDWISEQRALKQQIRDWDNSVTKLKGQVSAIVDEVSATQLGNRLPTSLERHVQTPKPVEKFQPLQPALQRMQPRAETETFDLDDAAAHESTEPIANPVSVPKDWYEQADILQTNRILRTSVPTPSPTMRWLRDMKARQAEYQKRKAATDAELSLSNADQNAKLEKVNAMLQAEVAAQKLAMSEHQDRSSHKIRSLRGELETAYKQSSVHADAFRDQIAGLNKELSTAQSNANEVQVQAIKERYSKKVASLQKELERAYVQSSVHADEFTKQIKDLETELIRLTKAAGDAFDAKHASKESKLRAMQGEGDFCPNVVKFAGSEMWYKQPSSSPRSSVQDAAKMEQKSCEKSLVSEVRSIYETAYGPIDVQHRQPRNARVTALEGALARHDKHAKYAFKDDGLESELTGEVISTAGDVIKHEKNTYAYKKDGLEAELKQKLKLETEQKAEKEYPYKKDGLEAELRQKLKLKTEQKDEKEYPYKDDGLESVLQNQAKLGAAEQPSERFAQDGLEAELVKQSKPAGVKQPSERFVHDNLEAELKKQGKSANSAVPSEKFVADNLEAELKKQDRATLPSEQSGRFKPDGLEAELRRLASIEPEYASDAYATEAAKHDKVSKMEKAMASSLGSELHMPAQPAKSTSSAAPTIQWHQPPAYKVVAYDSGNDRFSTAVTTSWDPTVQETPITVSEALSKLYQPARWMQHFASLQRDGYQVVHAREDLLVLKKVQETRKATDTTKPTPKTPKPFERQNQINLVDGTRSSKTVRPVTGDYANPTGYVNLDLEQDLTSKNLYRDLSPAAAASASVKNNHDAAAKDLLRITRQEPVFSGSQRVRSGKLSRRARREAEREQQHRDYWSGERKPRSLILWMLGVGAATSGVMYVTGSVAEKARAARLEKELRAANDAAKGGEGNRWRLDEGEWRTK